MTTLTYEKAREVIRDGGSVDNSGYVSSKCNIPIGYVPNGFFKRLEMETQLTELIGDPP